MWLQDGGCLHRSYLLAYNSHQLKDIFNVHTLDLVSVAKSFGFSQPPRVGPPSPSELLQYNGLCASRCVEHNAKQQEEGMCLLCMSQPQALFISQGSWLGCLRSLSVHAIAGVVCCYVHT